VLISCLVVVALAIGLIVIAAAIIALLTQIEVENQEFAIPGSVDPDRLASIDGQRTALTRVVQLVDLVGVGLLAMWARRLYANLRSLGVNELRFSEHWAIGGWFVPFLNLVRPKQIVDDIWRASDPVRRPEEAWDERPVSPLLHWWWFFWVVLWLPTLCLDVEDLSRLGNKPDGSFLAWCGAGQLLFGVLTIFVVVRTTSRQVRLATGDPVSIETSLTRVVASEAMYRLGADSDTSGAHLRAVRFPTMEES
jgi:hypothetical protein